jgi:TetR/AcrR family acrAB operon transcriptional repressor
MGRTKQQALGTRAKIIDAAERVFFVRGFARASLEDIASEAGVTRSAVYGHFRNKEAVFQAIFECADMPLDPFAVQSCEQDADPLQHLHAQLRQRLRDTLHLRRARRLYSIALTKCEATGRQPRFMNACRWPHCAPKRRSTRHSGPRRGADSCRPMSIRAQPPALFMRR